MRDTILEQESAIKVHKDTIEVLRKDLRETRDKLYNSVDHIVCYIGYMSNKDGLCDFNLTFVKFGQK